MKEKGSVLIFSILILSFLMTITLTMYYIARNKNKRSIYKLEGLKIDTELEKESEIANYELYLANEYVTLGHLYAIDGNGVQNYIGNKYPSTSPKTTKNYTKEIIKEGKVVIVPKVGEHYTGIVLNNINEYFGAKWDPTIKGELTEVDESSLITNPNVLSQPWIAEEEVVDGRRVSRRWLNNTNEKIIRLWTKELGKEVSIGGYRLTKIVGLDSKGKPLTLPLEVEKLNPVTPTKINLTYEKIISINKSSIEEKGTEDYRIIYEESVEVRSKGKEILIDKDSLKEIKVEKL